MSPHARRAGSLSLKAAGVLHRKKIKSLAGLWALPLEPSMHPETPRCIIPIRRATKTSGRTILFIMRSNLKGEKQREENAERTVKTKGREGNKEMLARFGTHPPLQGCYWRNSLPSSRHWEI